MKLQAAFEYMMVVAVVIAFILPLWAYNIGIQREATTELSLSYAKNMVIKIADTANLVGSQGPPAKMSLPVFIPAGVQNATITANVVTVKVWAGSSLTDVFEIAEVTLNGTLPTGKGNYILIIEAKNGYVQITPQE